MAFLLAFYACQQVESLPLNISYFPIIEGNTSEFEVVETNYVIGQKETQKKYFLKEEISQVKQISINELQFDIIRSKKNLLSDNYKLDSVWVGQKISNQIIINQNGTNLLKLVLPYSDNNVWNINTYNTQAKKNIKKLAINPKVSIGGITFENVLEVIIEKDSSLLNLRNIQEQYARDYGLIVSQSRVLDYCQATPDCIGKKQISFGKTRVQKLIRFNGKDIK